MQVSQKPQTGLPSARTRSAHTKQGGYSMVGTMVAVIVAAIGITGLSAAISNANILGNSAGQSALIAMAQRSTLAQLHTSLSGLSSPTTAYRFHSGESASVTAGSSLDSELQKALDELSFYFNGIQSTVNCENSGVVTCEVCFHWYDRGESTASSMSSDTAQGATNRSTCQIQIV